MVRCVVKASDARGYSSTTYTITRELAPSTDDVLVALDAPDDPRPRPPETCGSRAPDKPYLLLTDTPLVGAGTRAVHVRVPDDGCGSGQPAILAALGAAAWTELDRRVVTVGT